ncbi:MAG TPA: FAD-dependent oxidoreductase [Rhodanobacteraceae bacterium]|nr:FAD-dependent oxidoreductase [Rhodanobacteraceae bacterium]
MSTTAPVRCCIVGGGPAGMMLGLLLARAGVPVTVLEKHGDFLRDFRGDTVHPSTLAILDEIGLRDSFDKLPQRRIDHLAGIVAGRQQQIVDFRGLEPYGYLALVPQWDLLDMLADAGRKLRGFDLRMRHQATALIEENGRTVGVRVKSPEGDYDLHADLVIACDGRHSTLRESAGLKAREYGAPMDVLWFRMPRSESDPQDTFGIVDRGHMMVLLNRSNDRAGECRSGHASQGRDARGSSELPDPPESSPGVYRTRRVEAGQEDPSSTEGYWQVAFLVPKGSDATLRARSIDALRETVSQLAPFLADRRDAIESWDQVKTLEVQVDRLERWYAPGLLLIGDAAHAMSPIGGVGINMAIQDAVAAANALARPLREGGAIDESLLARIQQRREWPVRVVQRVQITMQKHLISRVLEQAGEPPRVPALLRFLLGFRTVRHLPARLFGYGLRQEHVHTPALD